MQNLQVTIDADGVALATIDVRNKPMNVLTPELQDELSQLIDHATSDPAIKGIIITSGKSNGFIAGADLKDLMTIHGRLSPSQVLKQFPLSAIYRRLETCGKPVAAAINGLALGGGLELCLATHYRVLSDNPRAVLGLPEVTVGLLPGAGGTQRLPRLIGIEQALPVMLAGTPLPPKQALKLGIVNELAPESELVARAKAWVLANPGARQAWDSKGFKVPGGVGGMAPHSYEMFTAGTSRLLRSTQGNLPAPLAISACVYEGTIVPMDTGLAIEAKYFAKLATGAVARNLIRTSFVNKGAADKLVRRPPDIARSQVKKLGVLGAGMMGASIAHVAAAAGIDVVLIDASTEQAARGKSYSEKILKKALDRGNITMDKMLAQLARIEPTTSYEKLAGCQLVIEAVFENREVKRQVTQRAAAVLEPTAMFASNTSTLPISGLAKAFTCEDRFIGLHFFSPVERMPLVEVIKGEKTSPETLAQALDFVAQLRKTPIVVNDSPGFFTSRVFGTYVDEGQAMLLEGVTPALIENAARMAGMPVGPLAVTDEVTIELQRKVYDQSVVDGLPEKFVRSLSLPVIDKMLANGRIGRRAGKGFYDYPVDGKKRLWPGLRELFPPAAQQPAVDMLRRRLLSIQALETYRCLEEGVIETPADADLGSVLGIGYPPWTGGALSYIETVGLREFVAECDAFAQRFGKRFDVPATLRERAERGQQFYDDVTSREQAA